MTLSSRTGAVLLIAVGLAACREAVDREKFDAVNRAAQAAKVEIHATGGTTPKASELVKTFQTEVASLDGRADGEKEAAALKAYKESADAMSFFLRLRSLNLDYPHDEEIIIAGTNEVAARAIGIPLKARGSSHFADIGEALRISSEVGDRKLAEANTIVTGR